MHFFRRNINACQQKKINISNFNTKNDKNMKNMLSECLLDELNLSNFDTNNVTDMNGMFSKCLAWKKIDLSIFNADNFENINLFLEKGINI